MHFWLGLINQTITSLGNLNHPKLRNFKPRTCIVTRSFAFSSITIPFQPSNRKLPFGEQVLVPSTSDTFSDTKIRRQENVTGHKFHARSRVYCITVRKIYKWQAVYTSETNVTQRTVHEAV